MRTITIDLNLALQYAQAEIDRLMSGQSSSASTEVLDRIRAQVQIPLEELSDVDLRQQVLVVAFRRIKTS